MKRSFAFVMALGVTAAVFFVPATASAERRQGGVIRLEEITIEGRVQKPNAFYVLQRSSLGYEGGQQRQSFINEVVDSIDSDPF